MSFNSELVRVKSQKSQSLVKGNDPADEPAFSAVIQELLAATPQKPKVLIGAV